MALPSKLGTIRDIHNPWRDQLLPAMYDGVPFFVDAGSRESGRRTVIHEFPKRDVPYSEDMGRRAIEYSVRGYIVAFMSDTQTVSDPNHPDYMAQLYMRDYRITRDRLQMRLDTGGEGVLQLPFMARAGEGDPLQLMAVCTRYRMTEENKLGGYVVFDMTFVQYGQVTGVPAISNVQLLAQAEATKQAIGDSLDPSDPVPP
jgi:hypothetical protein